MELHYFILLLIKHAIVDVGIQRHLGWMGKEKYFSKLAQQHYVGHGLGTFLALFLGSLGFIPSIIAAIFDWWCHWHIDHTKARINNRYEISASSNAFWWLLTVDQILHYLTYLVIVLFLV
tara:strand:+ start:142 stop:501 length:360 start_codon:yes stop_codon:yes gene_type:complete